MKMKHFTGFKVQFQETQIKTYAITICFCSDSNYNRSPFRRLGLGVMGGIGLGILTFVFGLQPTAPPIDVMLMIVAVITAAACMQAARRT